MDDPGEPSSALVWRLSLSQEPPPALAEAEEAIKRARTTLVSTRAQRLHIVAQFVKRLRNRV